MNPELAYLQYPVLIGVYVTAISSGYRGNEMYPQPYLKFLHAAWDRNHPGFTKK